MSIPQEKIIFFERVVADFFRKAGRERLPWRHKGITAYEVWVSEIMLQQTQVSRVVGYYERFLRRFPDVRSLARASWETFLPYYEGLGYYARGRNMLRAAQEVVAKHQGRFPRDAEVLRRLSGIGPYTAAAILSFAYGEDVIAWDTNIRRVIGRFFFGGKNLIADEMYWERTLVTPKRTMNAALMDFGSAICLARPKCGACPLSARCVYFRENGRREKGSKKQKIPSRPRALRGRGERVCLFLHEGHRIYYSAWKKTYLPFLLPRGAVTRAAIKAHFHERYGLTLAVRPPYGRGIVGGKLTLFVNAQILLGESAFATFPKAAVTGWMEKSRRGAILKRKGLQ